MGSPQAGGVAVSERVDEDFERVPYLAATGDEFFPGDRVGVTLWAGDEPVHCAIYLGVVLGLDEPLGRSVCWPVVADGVYGTWGGAQFIPRRLWR